MDIEQFILDATLKRVISDHQARLGHNDLQFVQRVYADGLGKYLDRLRAIGFADRKDVLDAGCGYGQWSLALAQLNQTVSACDISPIRVDIIGDVAKELAVSNLDLRAGSIYSLPYANASFDAVFCYGVIFLTPWRKSLCELARVLKPGGMLYVNANGLGWYIFLWQEQQHKIDDYDPKAITARSFQDTLRYDRQGYYEPGMSLIIEPQDIQHELRQLGFSNIQTASEGCLHLDESTASPKSFFNGHYCGQVGVYEVLAMKL